MDHDSIDLNDPIAAKLRDGETMKRLVRKAISEAVDKARKLGFLNDQGLPSARPDTNRQS